jgi:hypothetical protein
MSTPLSFGTNNITVYSYEPFSYRLSNNVGGTTKMSLVSRTSGIPASYISVTDSSAVFVTTSNAMSPSSQQFIINLTNASGTVVSNTSTTNVTSAPGRFTDGGGNSLGLSNYTFYLQEAITPIRLYAPFNIGTPTSSPSLPPGLSFTAVDASYVAITGTPLTTVPQSNYLVIGKQPGTSKVVSSTLPIIISNERIRTDISGGGIFSPMQIGVDVSANTITTLARGALRYTWGSLPDGIYATDNSGNGVNSGFFPSDPSKTLIIGGTPTLTTASNFRDGGYSNGFTQSIFAQRTAPTPLLSNTIPLTFAFGETVLFDTANAPPPYYSAVAVDPSATSFRAQTYFTSNVDISSIFSPNLRADMSLAFNGVDRAYLVGNPFPEGVGSNNYIIRAINRNGKTRDLTTTITVINDSVTFQTPPTPAATDVCYNFVFSRDVSFALNGYYPAPIRYVASSAAKRPIFWTSEGLAGTNLSLDICGNTATLVGVPESLISLRNLRVTATADGTAATATRDISFSVVNDMVTITPVNSNIPAKDRTLPANQPMTPTIQLTATALSGLPIRTFSATGLPPGVRVSRTGLINGTPTASIDASYTATISATTGFTTASNVYTFTNVRDNTIVIMPNIFETVPSVFSGVEFRTLGYSGLQGITSVSGNVAQRGPWQGTSFSVSMPDGINLQGDFSSVPALLPKYRIGLTGSLSNAQSITIPVEVNIRNTPTFVRHLIGIEDSVDPTNNFLKLVRNTGQSIGLTTNYGYEFGGNALQWENVGVSSSLLNAPYGIHDMAQNGNVIVAVLGSNMVRSADAGLTWNQIPGSNIQATTLQGGVPSIPYYTASPLFGCIATDGSSNWLAIANGWDGSVFNNILRTSSDNGVTWTDRTVSNFVDIISNTKLFYNNSRYFVAAGATAAIPVLYAEVGDEVRWFPAQGFISGDAINDLAFKGFNLLAVGSNGTSSACYSSSDNGENWTPLSVEPIPYSGSTQVNVADYAYGRWVVAGSDSFGNFTFSYSSDLVNWTPLGSVIGPGAFTASVEDESAWLFAGAGGSQPGYTAPWWGPNRDISSNLQGWGAGVVPFAFTKRITALTTPATWPSILTLSMAYDAGLLQWMSPTKTSYINWQFVPIETIHGAVDRTNISPALVYFYSYGSIDGLTFSIDDDSQTFDISGTAVTFSDATQRILVFASYYGDPVNYTDIKILPLVLSMRTILPTVQKQQSGAGAWTYLLRQYTEVNAATTSRDNKALPAGEYKLGQFTRPEPPNVITDSNCPC